ncbi:lipase family protein [Nocardia sp. NBC_01503]|uniref:lipase family protein n=1 Tax=Nocardia sp. NBC_01503 TaxID=2975997 RepID=UPI002E7B4092|nr:lipase family protein [Nocardia sp. NBC_01503]WTL31500.1 lipase family protein [Nocardia sp. NBC_01503]
MFSRLAATTALLVLGSAVAVPAYAQEEPTRATVVVPDQDPFYATPPDIDSYADGAIVSSREVGIATTTPARAWQLAYRTNDSHDMPELAVTTVFVPVTPWIGAGTRPAVSIQSAEDSTGTRCAPSYTSRMGIFQDKNRVEAMLAKNWAVVTPDFEGPKSAFLTGPQSGHAVLDGIRAAGQFAPAGIGTDAHWGLDGFSGGAAASGWAAQLQPTYAPELDFIGAALGGLPADLSAVMANVDGTMWSGFIFGALVSYTREFPEAGIDRMLNDTGRADLARGADKCVVDLLLAFPFRRLTSITSTAEPLRDPRLADALQRNSLGATAPTMPVFNYQADTDDVVPVGQADALVRSWRAGGTSVETTRKPQGTHVSEAGGGQIPALEFLETRFTVDGPPPVNIDRDRQVGPVH